MPASFAEVQELGPADVRGLLESGSPVERVWAAWSLGLRIGADAVPAARVHAERDPDAGVRRHIVVMLAGLGDWTAVEALAAGDPDPYVRASTLHCLRHGGRLDGVWRAMEDPSPVVVETAIVHLAPIWPEARLQELLALARSADLRVAVVEGLATRDLPGSALGALADLLAGEPEATTRRSIWDILIRHGRTVALGFAARGPARLQLELLKILNARLPWAEIRELREVGPATLERHVAAETAPIDALVRMDMNEEILAALSLRSPGDLTEDERQALVLLSDHLHRWKHDPDLDEYDEPFSTSSLGPPLEAALARHGIVHVPEP